MKHFSFILGCIVSYLSCCLFPSFNPSIAFKHFKEKGLSVEAKAYGASESLNVLSSSFQPHKIQPIELVIHNASDKELILCKGEGSEKPETLPDSIFLDAFPRSVALNVASFFFFPLSILSAADSLNTASTLFSFRNQIKKKALQEEERVPPFSSLTRLVYVKVENLKEEMDLFVKDPLSGNSWKKSFTVKKEL